MRVGKILTQTKNILELFYTIGYSTFGISSKFIFEKSSKSAHPKLSKIYKLSYPILKIALDRRRWYLIQKLLQIQFNYKLLNNDESYFTFPFVILFT